MIINTTGIQSWESRSRMKNPFSWNLFHCFLFLWAIPGNYLTSVNFVWRFTFTMEVLLAMFSILFYLTIPFLILVCQKKFKSCNCICIREFEFQMIIYLVTVISGYVRIGFWHSIFSNSSNTLLHYLWGELLLSSYLILLKLINWYALYHLGKCSRNVIGNSDKDACVLSFSCDISCLSPWSQHNSPHNENISYLRIH